MKNINEIQRRFKQNAKDEQQSPDRFIQTSAGSKGSGSGNAVVLVRSAKIITVTASYFTVKLIDDLGNLDTLPFTVSPIILNAANLINSSWPRLAAGHIIQVYRNSSDSTVWRTDMVFDKIINVNNFY